MRDKTRQKVERYMKAARNGILGIGTEAAFAVVLMAAAFLVCLIWRSVFR